MTIELEMLNDEYISVGDLKNFLSTIPDNYILTNEHMHVNFLKIKTDREFGTCELGVSSNESDNQTEDKVL